MGATARTAADEAWETMRTLLVEQRRVIAGLAGHLGLSPPQLYALACLDPEEPAPMSDLAEALRCDASNVTGIVHRLEHRGLVERQPAAHDRRVKNLLLTDAGRELHERIAASLDAAPAGFAALSTAEQSHLRDLLRKVASHAI